MRAWEQLIGVMLPPNARVFQVQNPGKMLCHESKPLMMFSKDYGYFAVKKPLVGKVTKSKEDTEFVLSALKHAYEVFYDPEVTELAVAEILTKVFAYRTFEEGLELQIPSLDGKNKLHLVDYRVDKIFDLWKNIPAFGLLPISSTLASPILLFRGTQFSPFIKSGRGSIIADLDPRGPGRTLFEYAKPKLKLWLDQTTKVNKARVMGYSLGGALAAYMLIDSPDFFSLDPNNSSYLFHLPGIGIDLFEKWQAMPQESRPAFKAFICEGDLVSKIGHLFGSTSQLKLSKPLPPISAHTTLLFSQRCFHIHSVDIPKENNSFYRRHYTIIHKSTSELFYKMGLKKAFPKL